MAKKKRAEEPENLERWLVSYGDFITLLFATFVVLYALAQVDATDFAKLEESLKNAFSQNTLMEGQQSIMDGQQTIFDQQMANSFIPSLMVEYISPKYEQESFQEIEEEIIELTKIGELSGISAKMTEQGLLITLDEKSLFKPGSANLDSNAKQALDKVGIIICKKFVLHKMIVEGHTDSSAINSMIYPSNWELSGARASSVVRYLISRFNFMPELFSAIGYADTRPAENAKSKRDAKNRRVEILILKNKYKDSMSTSKSTNFNLSKSEQDKIQKIREQSIKTVERDSISPAARKLLEENRKRIEDQKSENLSKNNLELYEKVGDNASKNNDLPKVEKKVIKLNSDVPSDEDFGL